MSPAPTSDNEARARRVDELLAPWSPANAPGLVVLVSRAGEPVYWRALGSANLEHNVPLGPETVFQSASLSKQMTAFAVALLARDNQLSLDDPVRRYIPELADFGSPLTIRHLIHHTSGLRDQWELLFFAGWRREDPIRHRDVLRLIGYQRTLNFAPGQQYLYTNTGYTLLAEIIARVTEQPFADWMATNVFGPLEMRDTTIRDSTGHIIKRRASSYLDRGDGTFERASVNSTVLGASNVFTTAGDLARWAHNLDTGVLGGTALVEQMQRPGTLESGETTGYAFGMFVGTDRGIRLTAHGGGVGGFRSYLLRAPEQALSVVVLANVNTVSAGSLAGQIADIYLEDAFADDLEPNSTPADTTASNDPAAYPGTYLIAPGLAFTVRQRPTGLTIQAPGEPEAALRATQSGTFEAAGYSAVSFESVGDGAPSLRYEGAARPAVTAFAPTPAQLDEFAGTYFASELRTTYELVVVAGRLTVRHPRADDVPIYPTVADQFGEDMADDFGIAHRWFRSFDFARDERGRITGFSLWVGGARNLWFEKR